MLIPAIQKRKHPVKCSVEARESREMIYASFLSGEYTLEQLGKMYSKSTTQISALITKEHNIKLSKRK